MRSAFQACVFATSTALLTGCGVEAAFPRSVAETPLPQTPSACFQKGAGYSLEMPTLSRLPLAYDVGPEFPKVLQALIDLHRQAGDGDPTARMGVSKALDARI